MRRGSAGSVVMAVGVAPGQSAINAGKAFAGNSLSRLLSWFCCAGYPLSEEQFRDSVYLTSLNKCAAIPDTLANRKRLWRMCSHFLWRQIEIIRPRLILVLGKEPADILLKQEGGDWNQVLGRTLTTSQLFQDDLFPPVAIETNWLFMPHPSGLSRTMNDSSVSKMVIESLGVELKRVGF
ncbi:uracil-DNA glycosylase family protein [Zoogloea sp.]|uniref:uracil-DNA glycosylase family protein n=1 Tax=Zoogloea sp. TaxID=49181 RepID=UPI0031FC13F6